MEKIKVIPIKNRVYTIEGTKLADILKKLRTVFKVEVLTSSTKQVRLKIIKRESSGKFFNGKPTPDIIIFEADALLVYKKQILKINFDNKLFQPNSVPFFRSVNRCLI